MVSAAQQTATDARGKPASKELRFGEWSEKLSVVAIEEEPTRK
jgi:hypothetical protein